MVLVSTNIDVDRYKLELCIKGWVHQRSSVKMCKLKGSIDATKLPSWELTLITLLDQIWEKLDCKSRKYFTTSHVCDV